MTTAWLTAAELSRLLKVPVGTIYRWACEDNWRRTAGRPVYYDALAAVSSHRIRHAERFPA